jgi:branched-chain amino acid aminotransferase
MIKLADGRTGEWFFLGNSIVGSQTADEKNITFGNSIYEVIRIINSIPLFIEDHFQRFENSARSIGFEEYPTLEKVKEAINSLCKKNSIREGNIRFEQYFDPSGKTFALYQVPHVYPTITEYKNGVKLISFQIERPNPHIKQSAVNSEVRSKILTIQKQENAYEVVLVNHLGEITEGSKSNIFFVSERTIYMPPSEVILEGITRKRLLKIIKNTNFELVEAPILLINLEKFDSCFLTGTSPKILPVSSIDKVIFNTQNKVVIELIQLFDNHILEYCRDFK